MADMLADMVANIEVDKVADMVADNKKINIDINVEIQFGERIGHDGGWLIGPKLFRPEAYPACASSKLCEFIHSDFWEKGFAFFQNSNEPFETEISENYFVLLTPHCGYMVRNWNQNWRPHVFVVGFLHEFNWFDGW